MRIVKEREARKQEILDGAIKVFTRKGYDKTSISDIASELNISQGLCYRYFPSKEAIYEAAIDEYANYIIKENMRKTEISGKTLREQIIQMSGKMDDYSSTEKGSPEFYELFHNPSNKRMHKELFMKVSQKLVVYITKVLENAKNRGEITISDPNTAAHFFVFGQMSILMDDDIPEEEKTQRIQACLFELFHI